MVKGHLVQWRAKEALRNIVVAPIDDTLHNNRPGTVVLEELLHFFRELGSSGTPDSIYIHGLCKGGEVGML